MSDFDTGDVVRLGCVMQNNGEVDVVNVNHVQILSGGGLAAPAAYQDFSEWVQAAYDLLWPSIVNSQLPVRISVANVTQGTVWGAIAWDNPLGGGNAGDEMASQVALLGFGRTPISRVQIRRYLGLFAETSMTDGLWVAGVRTAAQNHMDYLIVPVTMTNGLELVAVAYNYPLARATRALTAWTSGVPVIQRRRRVGRGS